MAREECRVIVLTFSKNLCWWTSSPGIQAGRVSRATNFVVSVWQVSGEGPEIKGSWCSQVTMN
jgi:hypothetical protein